MAARFWILGTGDWDGVDTTHWSTSSGGTGGASAPGVSDDVTFDGSSGGGTVTVTATVSVISISGGNHTGTLNTNGQTITCSNFLSYTGTGARTLTLGASAINLTGTAGLVLGTSTNMVLNANTSTVTFSGVSASGTFNASLTWNNIVYTGAGTSAVATCVCANFTKTGTANKTDILNLTGNVTCSGTFTCNGNSSINRVIVQSSAIGTARTITAATVTVTNSDFRDITGAGAGSWDLSAITGNSGDCGGNSGITFTTAATQTYTGGTDNWSTAARWTSRVPLPQDNVLMSGVTGGTITIDMPRSGKDIDWTGAAGTPAWAFSVITDIYGSITLISAMTTSGVNETAMIGRGTHSVTSAGRTFSQGLNFAAPGTYTLQDAFITSGTRIAFSGGITFNSGSFNITAPTFITSAVTASTLTLGTSTISITSTATATVAQIGGTSTFNNPNSTFVISSISSNTRTFAGGGKTFGTLSYILSGSTGGLDITGANTFSVINFSDATNARTLRFTAATTTTFTGAGIVGDGASGRLLVLSGITAATYTLTKASGTVDIDWWNITNALEGVDDSTWYAGTNSVDNGGNTRFVFTAPPTTSTGSASSAILSTLSIMNIRSM